MKPDVIVTWPHTCDFPLWRKFIREERHRFARVLVCFSTNMGGAVDYRDFVREQMADIAECFDSPPLDGRDWRDVAVNAALDRSDAEWVWFTEPDLLIHDPEFWRLVDFFERHDADMMGFWDTVGRYHPASLFATRSVIDSTPRYFGPVPNDHFVAFSESLVSPARVGILDMDHFEHLQGLAHNHYLADTGQPVTFHPERFVQYLRDCLRADVPLDPRWVERAERRVGVVCIAEAIAKPGWTTGTTDLNAWADAMADKR